MFFLDKTELRGEATQAEPRTAQVGYWKHGYKSSIEQEHDPIIRSVKKPEAESL